MTSFPPKPPLSMASSTAERNRLERQFRVISRAKREWEAAVDAVPDLVFLTDLDERVLRCNVAARDALGLPFEQILGRRLSELLASTWGCEEPDLDSAASELETSDGGRSFELTRFPTSSASESLSFVYVLRDLTELRRLQEVASRVDMMNNLGHVLSCVRHEIGNPVNAMKTALTVMAESLHEFSSDKMLAYIRRCQDDAQRIQGLLERLRTFNLFEVASHEQVDLRLFLSEQIAGMREALADQGIELECSAPEDGGPVEASCDAVALYQVLLGLIANASEAIAETDRPGLIRIDLRRRRRGVSLSVSDNGPGFDPDLIDRVVLPLFTTKSGGTGLGLAIAQTLLSQMGGSLEVGNDPDLRGARIELRLFPTDA